jgi:hypothetical protein
MQFYSESPEDLVNSLSLPLSSQKLKAIRTIKNRAIGNQTQKDSFLKLGLFPLLIHIVSSEKDIHLRIDSLATIGSLAYTVFFPFKANQEDEAKLEENLLNCLIPLLFETDHSLLTVTLRTLKAFITSSPNSAEKLFTGTKTTSRIVNLLIHPRTEIVENSIEVLLYCSEDESLRKSLVNGSTLELFEAIHWLLVHPIYKIQDKGLQLFSVVSREESYATLCIQKIKTDKKDLLDLLSHRIRSTDTQLRLFAATCLVNLCKLEEFDKKERHRYNKLLLPKLLALLDDQSPRVRETVPFLLVELLKEQYAQKLATETGVISKLSSMFSTPNCQPRLKEILLLCLAEICSNNEEARKEVVSWNLLGELANLLSSPFEYLCLAGCLCLLSLSRSLLQLSASLADLNLIQPLLKVVEEGTLVMKRTALLTLSNLVLETSKLKTSFVEENGPSKISLLLTSSETCLPLRRSCLLCLRNFLFLAHHSMKLLLLTHLPAKFLLELVSALFILNIFI